MSELEYLEPPKPPALVNSWPAGLSVEVALNSMAVGAAICSDEDLCKQFDITQEQLDGFKLHPAFRAEVREAISQVKDSNATIKRKARVALEFYADEYIPVWLADASASVDSKTKLLQFLAKISGLEAEEKAAEAAKNQVQAAAAPSINITLTTAAPMQVPTVTMNAEKVVN